MPGNQPLNFQEGAVQKPAIINCPILVHLGLWLQVWFWAPKRKHLSFQVRLSIISSLTIQSVVCRPVPSTSPESLLEVPSLRPHPVPLNQNVHFSKASRWFLVQLLSLRSADLYETHLLLGTRIKLAFSKNQEWDSEINSYFFPIPFLVFSVQ